MIHLVDVKNKAKELYYKHKELDQDQYSFMWEQCSHEYREAWMAIARMELGLDE